jgi:hypothetical protein
MRKSHKSTRIGFCSDSELGNSTAAKSRQAKAANFWIIFQAHAGSYGGKGDQD